MQRRSAVGRLAGVLAGLSIAKVPELPATIGPSRFSPEEVASWVLRSHSTMNCPKCKTGGWDESTLTPAGICILCSIWSQPAPAVAPISSAFWILTPEEIQRVDGELQRLHAEYKQLDRTVDWDLDFELTDEDQARSDRMEQISREALLLSLLREASRQFARA